MKNKNLFQLSALILIFSLLACKIPIDFKLKATENPLPPSEAEPSDEPTEPISKDETPVEGTEETSVPETVPPTTESATVFLSDFLPLAPIPASKIIYKLAMFTPTRGWAVTQDQNFLLVSEDGGETWLDATPSELGALPGDFTTHGIRPFFLDENIAWFTPYADGDSQIFHTIDGGITWEHIDVPFENVTYTFIDQEIGYALVSLDAGAGSFYVAIYRTLNSGSSWTMIFTHEPGTSKSLRESGIKNGITFLDVNNGWIGGAIPMDDYFYLFYTQDGGVTWTEETDISLPELFEGSMLDVGQPQFMNGKIVLLPVTAFTPANTSFLLLYRSANAGKSWQYQGSVLDGKSFSFYSENEGWIASHATLYHTLDGGKTLNALLLSGIPEDEIFIQIDFIDSLHGWALTTPDEMNMAPTHLYRTNDGGLNWLLLSP